MSTCPGWTAAGGEQPVFKSQPPLAHVVPEQRAAGAVSEGLQQGICFPSSMELAKPAAFTGSVPAPEQHCDYRTDVKSQNHCQNLE